jgi:3-hydroxyacyl-CoA dehydrogenase
MSVGGQETFKRMKYAPFPVVGAPAGMALGGGCEILLHCSAVQAHAESYIGLVEVGVGVIPGWGGCKELLTRWMTNPKRPGGTDAGGLEGVRDDQHRQGRRPRPTRRRTCSSCATGDGVTMNRDRLLADAKAKALALVAAGYRPPEPVELELPGPSARAALDMAVAGFRASGAGDAARRRRRRPQLAHVVTGGDTDVTRTVSARTSCHASSARRSSPSSRHRPRSPASSTMLETGKPLRN